MIYLGGVTLGYFNLYPVGFQPKEEQATREETPCAVSEERLPLEGSGFPPPAARSMAAARLLLKADCGRL
jgi:hypothetical protein